MERKNILKKNKHSGSILLSIVLVGFCILAVIEIICGQARIRAEREISAITEDNRQTVRQQRGSENGQMSADTGDTLSSNSVSVEGEEDGLSESAEDIRKYDMQIVFMGDGILDRDREDDGVAPLISQACNARIYNMAISGTAASLMPDEQYDFETWTSMGLLGVVNAILGNIDSGIFDGYRAGEVLSECDFSETDYFVIEYGINDFLCRQIPQSIYLADGGVLEIGELHTYSGALERAVTLLQDNFPNAKILLIPPHYCQVFEEDTGTYVGDAYSVDYGHGSLVDFYRCAEYVAKQHAKESVIFYDTIENSGIDAYTADDYLQDGIHLTAEGRRVYADYASGLIMADFYPEE